MRPDLVLERDSGSAEALKEVREKMSNPSKLLIKKGRRCQERKPTSEVENPATSTLFSLQSHRKGLVLCSLPALCAPSSPVQVHSRLLGAGAGLSAVVMMAAAALGCLRMHGVCVRACV
jgi:hypothetical protein